MKTKTYIIFTLSLLLSLLLVTQQACKKEDQSSPPNEDEVSIPETTKVIDQNTWNSNFIGLDSTDYTITFKKEITNTTPIYVGDIIVSQDGNGLLRKVTGIENSGGNIVVKTSFASLTKAIENGSFSVDYTLSKQKISKINFLREGVTIDTSDMKSTEETAIVHPIDTYLDPAKKVHLTGSITFLPSIQSEVVIKWFKLKKFTVDFVVEEQVNLECTIELLTTLYENEVLLADYEFTPFIVQVGPLPVLIQPVVELYAGVEFKVESELTTGVGQSLNYSAGMLFENGQWSSNQKLNKQLYFSPPEVTEKASAKVYIKPQINMYIYDVLAPYLAEQYYGRIEAEPEKEPWWSLYAGVNMGIGAKMLIIDDAAYDYYVKLIEYEILLAEANTPPNTPSDPIPENNASFVSGTTSLQWKCTDPDEDTLTFDVYFSPDNEPALVASNQSELIYNPGTLIKDTQYYWKIVAKDGQGNETEGPVWIFTTTDVPIADFTATPTNGSAPLTVNFTDQSTNNPTEWQWDFGDGGTAHLPNFSHTYTNEGTYTVTLTATNEFGSDVVTKTNYIAVSGGTIPVAEFTATPTTGNAPLTVSFTDQSENDPTTWQWDFGNGSTSTQQNPSHTYNTDGSYTVTLTATNEYGSDTETKTNYITVTNGGGNGCEGVTTVNYGGQIYNTVEIGNQCWFKENLNYETSNSWWYDNSSANGDVYGRLYTWNDALTACPSGWHLPSYDEWIILSDYLGGIFVAGGKMKETGTEHWNSPNTGATNSSGFTGLPGGYRYPIGYFDDLGFSGMSWSATEVEVGSTEARYRNLGYSHEALGHGNYYKEGGLSVRCLKD